MNIAINSLEAWILAFRLKVLGAIFCPVMLGLALAFKDKFFDPWLALMTIFTSLLLQILANVVNDYGDFQKGSDTSERLGPPRVMHMGLITKPFMLRGIFTLFCLILACGSVLVFHSGWVILAIGIFGLFFCFWYTVGIRPLAYLGFAEIPIFFIFGPIAVSFAYYVQTLSFSPEASLIGITPGCLASALLLTNNLRDLYQDKKHKKMTMAVRLGEQWARRAIVFLIASASLGPLILVFFFGYSSWLLPIVLIIYLPLSYLKMIIFEPVSRRFNEVLMSIGRLLYLLSFILSLGLVYGAP